MNFKSCVLLSMVTIFWPAAAIIAEDVELVLDKLVLQADWESSEQKQEAVLLLHGTMAHKDMEIMQALQDGLADNEISSLAITLSLGQSKRSGMFSCAKKQTHLYTDALVELAAWVNWLKQQGINRIWLLGHSRGANQATAYALTHAQQIAGLILVAPPVLSPVQLSEKYQQNFAKSLPAVINEAEMDEHNGELSETGFLHCQEATVSAASFLSYYRDARPNTVAMLEKLEMPVLLVSGSEDKVSVGVGSAGEKLEKDNISLLAIEGADHFFRDLYADEIVDEILELMATSE